MVSWRCLGVDGLLLLLRDGQVLQDGEKDLLLLLLDKNYHGVKEDLPALLHVLSHSSKSLESYICKYFVANGTFFDLLFHR
jgi:hypothetical protein